MFLLLIVIVKVLGEELQNITEQIQYLKQSIHNQSIEIQIHKEYYPAYYGGYVISNQIEGDIDQICKVRQSYLLMRNEKSIKVIADEFGLDYFQHGLDELIGMIHFSNNIAMISNNYYLYIYDLNQLKQIKQTIFSDYLNNQSDQYQLGVYSNELHYLYLFYGQSIIIYNDQLQEFTNQSYFIQDIKEIMYSKGHIFISTKLSIEIYKVNPNNGQLINTINFNFNDLRDITIGGNEGEYLYVLLQSKVQIYKIIEEVDGLNLQILSNSTIQILNGFAFDQYDDQKLLILSQISENHIILYDYSINIQNSSWFLVNQYYLKGETMNIKINKDLALVQGIDSQYLIQHSILNLFQDKKQIVQIPFHFADAITLDFHQLGDETEINGWYTNNKAKTIIFGIYPDGLQIFAWQMGRSALICKSDEYSQIGQDYSLNISVNTTDCQNKQKLTEFQSKDLIFCSYSHYLKIHVVRNEEIFKMELLIGLLILCGMSFGLIFIIVIICFRKYKQMIGELSNRLKKYNKLEMEQDIKDIQMVPNSNFKIDENEE